MAHATVACPVMLTAALTLARPAWAQDGIFANMQKGVDVRVSSVSTTTTLASGEVMKTETTNFFPAFTLNLDALVYPSLRLNTGGVFELSRLATVTNDSDTTSTISRNRPFFLLRSTSPVFSPGFGYFRREDRARTAGLSDVKLVNDEYAGYLGWNPPGGPRSDVQFLRTHTFDGGRGLQDVTRQFGSLLTDYTRGNLGASYRGTYLKTDDQVEEVENRQVLHAARVSDSGALIRKRLLWNATYHLNHQNVGTVVGRPGGEVALPITPFAGLASLSDTPVTSRLSPNAQLVDGNLAAGAGINIGLAPPPGDARARNIGLDFLNPAEVNRLLIWVDRDLPVEVSNSFSWEIYSSADNVVWRREAIVSSAPFGPFETRFELDFSTVTARYVKVVTRPLSVTVPESSRFVDILVTEVQAFLRRSAGEISRRLTQTTHLLNTDMRMRLLDSPSLSYEGFFLYHGPSAFGTSTSTVSNGLSVNHAFGRIFTAYGRAAREQGTEPRGDRVATVANATFTADPIPTFRSSVLFSSQDERVAGLPNTRRGLFFQNAAQVYRGIDVLFGIGWNLTSWETGEDSRDRLVNATATIVPRQHVNLTVSYDDTTTARSGTFVGDPRSHVRRFYGAVAVDPTRTLHLVLGRELLAISGQPTRATFDIGANWAPFPDGALQFIFAHNEALRAVEFGKDRSTVGAIRWTVTRRSFVDVSYQRTKSEFVFQTTATRVFSVNVRLFV